MPLNTSFKEKKTLNTSLDKATSQKDVLFQVSKNELENGLRGFPVGYCPTSYVDPRKGLFYRGKPLKELVGWDSERVIFLLFYGKEGNSNEIAAFRSELQSRAVCSRSVVKHISLLPRGKYPMKMFAAALLILGMVEEQGDYEEDALNLIAKLPHLTAIVINTHAGWGTTPDPSPNLGYMENFASMLQLPVEKEQFLIQTLRLFNTVHYDHGGGNLSTFVAKAVASSLEGLYGALAAGMCALSGPRHGEASRRAFDFIQSKLLIKGYPLTAEGIRQEVYNELKQGHLLYGYGHAVLRSEDIRATLLFEYANKHLKDRPVIQAANILRKEVPQILRTHSYATSPYPNVDAISGSILSAVGFSYPEYFALLFGMSRCIGASIQVLYERKYARGGKGTPLVRPTYFYQSSPPL